MNGVANWRVALGEETIVSRSSDYPPQTLVEQGQGQGRKLKND